MKELRNEVFQPAESRGLTLLSRGRAPRFLPAPPRGVTHGIFWSQDGPRALRRPPRTCLPWKPSWTAWTGFRAAPPAPPLLLPPSRCARPVFRLLGLVSRGASMPGPGRSAGVGEATREPFGSSRGAKLPPCFLPSLPVGLALCLLRSRRHHHPRAVLSGRAVRSLFLPAVIPRIVVPILPCPLLWAIAFTCLVPAVALTIILLLVPLPCIPTLLPSSLSATRTRNPCLLPPWPMNNGRGREALR